MDAFFRCAKHVPGLGGPDAFDRFTLDEVEALMDQITADIDRQAAALGKK